MSLYEPDHEKTCLMPYANNKGADQPVHPRSLISLFVARCLDSLLPIFAASKFSRLWLTSVAEQAGLILTGSQTPEDMFSHDVAQLCFLFLSVSLEGYDLCL